jgi:hypothetical protein
MPDLHGTFGLASDLRYALTNKNHQLIDNGFKLIKNNFTIKSKKLVIKHLKCEDGIWMLKKCTCPSPG